MGDPQFLPPRCGPALMARGCFGALHLAAACPPHDKDSWKQANRKGMCVRETEAIIGKVPRLGIHTRDIYTWPHAWNAFSYVSMTLRGILRNNFIKWVVCAEGCETWSRGWVGRVWLGGKVGCSGMGWEGELDPQRRFFFSNLRVFIKE